MSCSHVARLAIRPRFLLSGGRRGKSRDRSGPDIQNGMSSLKSFDIGGCGAGADCSDCAAGCAWAIRGSFILTPTADCPDGVRVCSGKSMTLAPRQFAGSSPKDCFSIRICPWFRGRLFRRFKKYADELYLLFYDTIDDDEVLIALKVSAF